jgi:hypothetical protein
MVMHVRVCMGIRLNCAQVRRRMSREASVKPPTEFSVKPPTESSPVLPKSMSLEPIKSDLSGTSRIPAHANHVANLIAGLKEFVLGNWLNVLLLLLPFGATSYAMSWGCGLASLQSPANLHTPGVQRRMDISPQLHWHDSTCSTAGRFHRASGDAHRCASITPRRSCTSVHIIFWIWQAKFWAASSLLPLETR